MGRGGSFYTRVTSGRPWTHEETQTKGRGQKVWVLICWTFVEVFKIDMYNEYGEIYTFIKSSFTCTQQFLKSWYNIKSTYFHTVVFHTFDSLYQSLYISDLL